MVFRVGHALQTVQKALRLIRIMRILQVFKVGHAVQTVQKALSLIRVMRILPVFRVHRSHSTNCTKGVEADQDHENLEDIPGRS